jgi:cell division protease FtsH
LKVHSKGKAFEETVDFKKIAQTTVGFTGADLANLLNESALLAARKNKSLIGQNDIDEAFIKTIAGPQKKSAVIDENDKKRTAYHEAAHAVVGHIVSPNKRTPQISVIPAGMAAGYTLHVPVDDRREDTKKQFESEISMLLAGRIAERLIMDDYTAGASSDMKRATTIARNMVTRYGMSELGPIVFGSDHGEETVFLGRDFGSSHNYSEETAAKIDKAINEIISRAYDRAEKILKENLEKLHFIAEYLIKYETMEEAEFLAAMADPTPSLEEVYAIGEARRAVSAKENEQKKSADEEKQKRLEAARAAERERIANDPRRQPK